MENVRICTGCTDSYGKPLREFITVTRLRKPPNLDIYLVYLLSLYIIVITLPFPLLCWIPYWFSLNGNKDPRPELKKLHQHFIKNI